MMRWSILAPWLITIALFLGLVATAAVAGQHPGIGGGGAELVAFFGLIGIWGVANATVGALIASRRPENRIGRILQAGGPLVIGVFLGFLISAIRAVTAGPGDLLGALAGWWAAVTIFPAILVAWPLVAILFPDGRLPGTRWRGPVVFIAIGEVAISGIAAITVGPVAPGLPDNPLGVLSLTPGIMTLLGLGGTALLVLSLVLAVTAIGVRWHRGDRLLRAQLKWLLGALGVGAVLFPLGFGGEVVNPLDFLGVASATLMPIGIGIAILRYRLYEIDRIISRTLTYGLLTLVLVGVYAAGVALLQTVLAPFTSGGGPVAVAASTLAAVVLFQPLRRRIHAAMDRRFNRSRYDAQLTVHGFAGQVRDEVDLERLRDHLRAVIDSSLAPTSVSVWLRSSDRTAR
ncbi:MAG TPA: hypothetical protein VHM48_12595 [Candidatus Limnocylindrales bacterium]|nr:hypothetical protein [Candidatus Limnocylindrales bacterium]